MENNPKVPALSRAKKLLVNVLSGLAFLLLLVLLSPIFVLGGLFQLVRAGARLAYTGYRAFMHRHVESVGLFGGLAIMVAVSYGLYLIDPATPSLHEATLQVLCFAPVLLFINVHVTIFLYKHLLPTPFKAFMAEIGEKINAASLPPLEELLDPIRCTVTAYRAPSPLETAQFKLKYYTLKFTFRCVRYVLFSLPAYFIYIATKEMLVLALNLQPHS